MKWQFELTARPLTGVSVTLMESCGQTTGDWNRPAAAAFPGIGLEAKALTDRLQGLIAKGALLCPNKTELFDGILDVLVVTTGAGTSTGFPMAEGWDEVFRSNTAKVDPTTDQVKRRADRKVLKPEGWTPPDLESILAARGIVELLLQ